MLLLLLSAVLHLVTPDNLKEPTSLAVRTDPFWKRKAEAEISTLLRFRDFLRSEWISASDPASERPRILPDDAQRALTLEVRALYGRVPEVLVDVGTGAIFPIELEAPKRTSYFHAYRSALSAHQAYDEFAEALGQWKESEPTKREKRFDALPEALREADEKLAAASRAFQASETWVQPHLEALSHATTAVDRPLAYLATEALYRPGSSSLAMKEAQDAMRPGRERFLSFLPRSFRGAGKVVIPTITDIQDPVFLREFEGAIETHWNESPWAKKNGVSFSFTWEKIGENQAFRDRKENLERHLERFRAGRMILTTGERWTRVIDRAIVLGSAPITPRTLAHEFGHILGYRDCYFRTVADQNVWGIGVLEWKNPFFPDELMCDANWGVAHQIR